MSAESTRMLLDAMAEIAQAAGIRGLYTPSEAVEKVQRLRTLLDEATIDLRMRAMHPAEHDCRGQCDTHALLARIDAAVGSRP